MEHAPLQPWEPSNLHSVFPDLATLPKDYEPVPTKYLKFMYSCAVGAILAGGPIGFQDVQTGRCATLRWQILATLKAQGVEITNGVIEAVATRPMRPATTLDEAIAAFKTV